MGVVPSRYRFAAVPHLMIEGAAEAIEFYTAAFGAEELMRIAHPNGRVLHAEVRISGSVFMLGDAEGPFISPPTAGGTTVGIHVYVEDVDVLHRQAVEAGAESIQQPTDMFYGDRTSMVKDPFGHVWVFLTHLQDLSSDDIAKRGNALLRG